MTAKRSTDNSAVATLTPSPGFMHKSLPNGITISTCLDCNVSIGSPTSSSLKMAEINHRCAVRPRKSK